MNISFVWKCARESIVVDSRFFLKFMKSRYKNQAFSFVLLVKPDEQVLSTPLRFLWRGRGHRY
jgi:hypothetical protein